MVLTRYIFRRFFTYFFLVNTGLTLLYNFIEFFEKLTRTQNVNVLTIIEFILLNLLPCFFDLIPLGAWLATCLLFRELYQKKELESFQLVGIHPNKILCAFLYCGLMLSFLSFVGKEIIVYPLSQMSEIFKMEQLKRNTYKRLYNQWFMPKNNNFLYFQVLDIEENKGEGVSLLFMDENFVATQKVESKMADLSTKNLTLTLTDATSWSYQTNETNKIKNKTYYLPGLFAHLKMYVGIPSLKRQISNLFLIRKLLPKAAYNQEIGKLLSRLFSHLQPLLYIILSFCFFFVAPQNRYYRWILIFLVYPVFLILFSLADFALQHNSNFLVILLPYLLALIILIATKLKFIK